MSNIRVLITGGMGFIGAHLVEHFLKNTDWNLVLMDRLSYSSFGYERLRDINVYASDRIHIVNHDLTIEPPLGVLQECGNIDYIVHMAAETHVDNSITDPLPFIHSNVLATHHALFMAQNLGASKIIYFSTDEVFGSAPHGYFNKESDSHNPSNPYAATKSAGEMLARAYHNTYNVPVIITRTMNVFGERQHPEKFIPMVIQKVRDGEEVIIHADATRTIAGSRVYLHARNSAAATLFVLQYGKIGEAYHIVGEEEIDNLTLAKMIAEEVGKPLFYSMVDWHSSRPGHDLRYAMEDTKLKKMGFSYPRNLHSSLRKMIRWTLENEKWLKT
jgi:dTDP-glucose 4,6-dehydratase